MSATETVLPPGPVSGIGSISASVPFEYDSSSNTILPSGKSQFLPSLSLDCHDQLGKGAISHYVGMIKSKSVDESKTRSDAVELQTMGSRLESSKLRFKGHDNANDIMGNSSIPEHASSSTNTNDAKSELGLATHQTIPRIVVSETSTNLEYSKQTPDISFLEQSSNMISTEYSKNREFSEDSGHLIQSSEEASCSDANDNKILRPPHILVRLYRPKSLSSLKQSDSDPSESETEIRDSCEEMEHSNKNKSHYSSSPDLSMRTKVTLRPIINRWRRFLSASEINEDENKNSGTENEISPRSADNKTMLNSGGKWKRFAKNKRASTTSHSSMASPLQIKKMVSFSPEVVNIGGVSNNEVAVKTTDEAPSCTENKAVEIMDCATTKAVDERMDHSGVKAPGKEQNTNERDVELNETSPPASSNDTATGHVQIYEVTHKNRNSSSDTIDSTGTNPTKRSNHSVENKYCTLLKKFTTSLPKDEIAEKTMVIKDATDLLPLDNGEVIIADILSNKLVQFDAQGFPKVMFAMEKGSEPWSVSIAPGDCLAVTLKGEKCVCLWSLKGEALAEFGEDVLSAPTGIQYDHLGRFVVTDEGRNSISLFSRSGEFLGEFFNPDSPDSSSMANKAAHTLNQPRYVSLSRDGQYFVSDSANQTVKVFDDRGNVTKVIGSYGREDGQFRFPYGIAFDEDTKLVYVADHFNNRISVFGLDGRFSHHVLTEADGIKRPKGLAIQNSRLYVTFGDMRAGNVSAYRLHANQ